MDKGRNSFQIPHSPEMDNYGDQLQNVINNLPCAFAIFNVIRSNNEITDFICSYINKTGLSELGLSEEATLNKKLKEIFSQNSEVLFRECFRVINDNVPYRFDLPFNIINKNKRKTEKTFDISIAKLNESVTLSWVNIDRNGKQLKRNKNEVKLLPDSEEIFIKTFYASPDAIIVSRLNDGKILEINSSAETLFGYTKNEIISKTSAELGLFADHSNRDIALSLLKENESVRDFSIDVVRKSGEVRQASLSIEFLNVEGERCILKSIRDITERKRIEQALLESEKKYRNTLDNLLEGCAIISFDWIYIYVNPVNAIHAHLRPEDMIGMNMLEIIPGVENSVFFTAYKRCMEERLPQQVEAGFTFADGSTAWFQAIAQPVPEGIFVLSMDITQRKLVEEALKKREEILNLILDNINEGIIVSEAPDGKIIAISKWGINHTIGKSVDAVIDLPVEHYLAQWDVRDINTGAKTEPERLPVARALKGEVIRNEEWLMVRPDKTSFITSVNAVPIYDKDNGRVNSVVATWIDITERKQMEEALRISETQLDAFFANSPAILNLVDGNFCYINTDKLTPTYYGLNRKTIKGKCVQDLSPDFIEQTGGVMQRVIETGEPILDALFQSPVPGRDGEIAYWRTSFFRVPLGHEKWGVGVISIEITDIKRSEAKLMESEDKFRTMADNISQFAWMADFDGSIFWYNKRWYDYTGTTFEEMQGWNWKKVHHPDHIDHVMENWTKALKEGNPWEDIFPLRSKDGEYRWFLSRALPIHDDNGKILSWFGTNTDITEHKKAEEELRKSQEILSLILDHVNEGIIVSEAPDGKAVAISRWGANYTIGRSIDAIIDLPVESYLEQWDVRDINTREKIQPERLPVYRALRGEVIQGEEILIVQREGTDFIILANAVPIYNEDKTRIVNVISTWTDITERKKAEEAMQKSEHRFRTLVTASSEVLYRMNPDWSEMTQLIGRGFLANTENPNPNWLQEYIHPDDQHQVLSVIKKAIRNKSTFELEHRVRQLNGGWGWTYSRAVPLMDTNGKIIEWFGAAADFTKRKQAEEAIKKAKEQYDLLFYSISEGFANYQAIYDKNGRLHDLLVLEINPAGAEFSGVKREDQIGKTWKQVWNGIEDHLFDIYREVDRKGEAYIFEHFSGITKRWYTNRIYKIAQNQFAVTFFDITELKKTEEELRISKELYQSVVETQHDLIVKVDIAGRFTFVNEAYCKKFGFKREDLIGSKTFKPLVYEEDLPNTLEKLKELEHPPFRAVMEQRAYTVEGLRWIEWEDSAIKNDKGEIIEIQGVGRDIHERKIAEEALKESEAKLLDAQKLARMGNYTVNTRDNSIEWSEELYNIWELDKNKPIPPFEELWNMVHPDDRQKVKLALESEILTNEKVETELRLLFPGNRVKYIQLITRGFFDEAGNLIKRQGVEIDITERKEAMLNLERALKELELSNRDIEQYAFVTSHDLREPIRMVYSYSQLLEKKFKSQFGQNADIYLGFIREGAERLNMLVQDLFNYTQIGIAERNFVTVDINNILQSVIYDMNNKIIESNAVIKYSELPEITADPSQIKQLFYQIIDNAIKFKSKDEPVIEIKCIVNEKEWLISIKDNGIGFKQEYSELIFSVFQRLNSREEYTGNGVGLAICKRIIGHHNGKIWAESEPGNGSTFYFTIPKN